MPTEKHANNFDFLRLLLASFVIITHSYPLTGREEHDWLYQITNGQTLFSYIAVRGFFAISGYLIFQSMLQSKNIINYYWKRFLRIFPGLFIVLLLSSAFCYFAYTEGGGGAPIGIIYPHTHTFQKILFCFLEHTKPL